MKQSPLAVSLATLLWLGVFSNIITARLVAPTNSATGALSTTGYAADEPLERQSRRLLRDGEDDDFNAPPPPPDFYDNPSPSPDIWDDNAPPPPPDSVDNPNPSPSPAPSPPAVDQLIDCLPRMQAATAAAVCTTANGVNGTVCPILTIGAGACGSSFAVASYQQATRAEGGKGGIQPVTSIAIYRLSNSNNIDAMIVTYANGMFDAIGSQDALAQPVNATFNIRPNDRVKEVALWTDNSTGTLGGFALVMFSADRFTANGGRLYSTASLNIRNSSLLGTGLLLGMTAATNPSNNDVLSSLSLLFFQAPISAAITVDMPTIDMSHLVFTPLGRIDSNIRNVGSNGSAITATCPAYSVTASKAVTYTNVTDAQRHKALLDPATGVLIPSTTSSSRLSAMLQFNGSTTLANGQPYSQIWTGQVIDIFADSDTSALGNRTETITAPVITFSIPSGQSAACNFIYSTVSLTIPYMITAVFYYDADGVNNWMVAMNGEYKMNSFTNMETLVTFTTTSAGAIAAQTLVAKQDNGPVEKLPPMDATAMAVSMDASTAQGTTSVVSLAAASTCAYKSLKWTSFKSTVRAAPTSLTSRYTAGNTTCSSSATTTRSPSPSPSRSPSPSPKRSPSPSPRASPSPSPKPSPSPSPRASPSPTPKPSPSPSPRASPSPSPKPSPSPSPRASPSPSPKPSPSPSPRASPSPSPKPSPSPSPRASPSPSPKPSPSPSPKPSSPSPSPKRSPSPSPKPSSPSPSPKRSPSPSPKPASPSPSPKRSPSPSPKASPSPSPKASPSPSPKRSPSPSPSRSPSPARAPTSSPSPSAGR